LPVVAETPRETTLQAMLASEPADSAPGRRALVARRLLRVELAAAAPLRPTLEQLPGAAGAVLLQVAELPLPLASAPAEATRAARRSAAQAAPRATPAEVEEEPAAAAGPAATAGPAAAAEAVLVE
jgi:hypothetical protein